MVFSYFRSYLYFSSCRKWCSISSINRRRRITIRAAPGTHFYVAFLSCPPPVDAFRTPPSTSRPNLISWIGIMPGQALSKLTYKHQGHTKSGENTPLWRSSRAPPSGLHTPALRWLLTLNTASRLASSNIAFPSNLRHLTPRVESSSPVGTSTKDPSHPTQKPSQSSPQASKENR